MNPAYLAVIAVTEFPLMAVALGVVFTNHRERVKALEKMADRVRLVSPPASKKQPDADAAGTVEDLSKRRTGT